MQRAWGEWTRIKLDALDRYLSAFTTASAKAHGTLYLDLFAGSADNAVRETGETLEGSALRALAARPEFDKLIFCEKSPSAARSLETRLQAAYPGRDFQIRPEDCNRGIPLALERLSVGWRFAPTFAFVDQYSAQIDWETVRFLAEYKHSGRSKVEQWIYFGDPGYPRGLRAPNGGKNGRFADRLDAMFGTRQWRQIMAAREDGAIGGRAAQLELINLYRWRLERVLGYRLTRPLAVPNTTGRPIYTLIFATDHEVGSRIMSSVFEIAEADLRSMVRQRREDEHRRRRFDSPDQGSLFDAEPLFSAAGNSSTQSPPLLVSKPRVPFEYEREWTADD